MLLIIIAYIESIDYSHCFIIALFVLELFLNPCHQRYVSPKICVLHSDKTYYYEITVI